MVPVQFHLRNRRAMVGTAPDDAIGSPGDQKGGEMEVEEQFGSTSEEAGGMARAGQDGSFPLSFPFVIFFSRRGRGCPTMTARS